MIVARIQHCKQEGMLEHAFKLNVMEIFVF